MLIFINGEIPGQNFSSIFPGVETLLLLDVPPQKIKTFIYLWAFCVMQAKSMSFNGDFFCCCRYAVTMRLLKVSLQKLRINWTDRMILCAPGKWIVHLITVECSITQAKLSVDINVLIFTPINCMYLGEINYCSSYLLLPNKILFKVEFVL